MSKPLVLLIEDDTLIREMFTEILDIELDVEIEGIADGQHALDRLAGAVADVVLLDLHLPKVSGLDVLTHIRKDSRWMHVSVIVLSADVLLIKTTEGQADLTLVKPVSFEDLVRFVSRFITPFESG